MTSRTRFDRERAIFPRASFDKVMCRHVWRLTYPTSDKKMQFHGFVLWRFKGDKIADVGPISGGSLFLRDVLTAIAIAYRFKSHSAFPFEECSVNSQCRCGLPFGGVVAQYSNILPSSDL
jgi:hypothetical protein